MKHQLPALRSTVKDVIHWRQNEWTDSEVWEELEQILSSQFFAKSARLSRFLRTVVEYLLEGKAEQLKEYTVGIEVYDRRPTYDPAQDTIVRTEARRLRTKLKEYYSCNHPGGSVMILLEPGSYVPVIKVSNRSYRDQVATIPPSHDFRRIHDDFRVAIEPFSVYSADSEVHTMVGDLIDELVFQLSQNSKLKVFRSSSDRDSFVQLKSWKESGVNVVIYGSVRIFEGRMRAVVHLATLTGMIVWAQRFDLQSACESTKDHRSDFVSAIMDRLECQSRSLTGIA